MAVVSLRPGSLAVVLCGAMSDRQVRMKRAWAVALASGQEGCHKELDVSCECASSHWPRRMECEYLISTWAPNFSPH